jgi:hypothetical protein
VIPELCVVEEVERGVGDTLVVWGAPDAKISFAAVKPWQWIARAIEFWKLKFVCSEKEVATQVLLIISTRAAAWSTGRFLELLLDARKREIEGDLLLSLLTNGVFECGQGIRHRLHRPHNVLDRLQVPDYVGEGDFFFPNPCSPGDSGSLTHGGMHT